MWKEGYNFLSCCSRDVAIKTLEKKQWTVLLLLSWKEAHERERGCSWD